SSPIPFNSDYSQEFTEINSFIEHPHSFSADYQLPSLTPPETPYRISLSSDHHNTMYGGGPSDAESSGHQEEEMDNEQPNVHVPEGRVTRSVNGVQQQ
ncbi:hypothetical protein PMAYCL1PPCAC_26065, partial [Pristionchus mayeri]